jgi:hypothetical protein
MTFSMLICSKLFRESRPFTRKGVVDYGSGERLTKGGAAVL